MDNKRFGPFATVASILALLLTTHCAGKSVDSGSSDDPASGGSGATTNGMGDTGGTSGDGDGDISFGGAGGVEDFTPIGQVDLLFVIDNSISMSDKQEMLRQAVPAMLQALVNPPCIDREGASAPAQADGTCDAGAAREYAPLDDIHIGVITSSIGGHGSKLCSRVESGWNNDDQAHLIPTVRDGVPTSDPLGFLAWSGGEASAADQLVRDFADQVSAVGEYGCGFEAPLEAWYRFLVDPQPPQELIIDANGKAVMATDGQGAPLIDEDLLAQREAFLRPESLLNVIVLTDENDCSAMDGGSYYNNAGFGYLVSEASFSMPIATPVCETNPNDECCFSCLQKYSPPDGCSADACDGGETLSNSDDRANVRCFENKRRFGVDLLYPTQRYVDGLSEYEIIDARDGTLVPNPLLMGAGASNAGKRRPMGRVYFTGIIGVPWQDIVTQESLDDPEVLAYLSAEAIAADFDFEGQTVNRWDVILGSRGGAMSSKICLDSPDTAGCGEAPVPPLDPFMIESIGERQVGATNPISGDAIVSWNSTDPTANNINGHEANHQVADPAKFADGGPVNDDLQYACIFPLTTPKVDCTEGDLSCDCGDEPLRNRPLCQPSAGGPAGSTQYYGKAYPGIRILEVLRDFGKNSVVSSICPKIPSQGYTPTVTTIIERMKERFPVVK